MRHCQWNDPSWEERKFAEKELTFDEDASDGGCIVFCGWCDHRFNEKGLENCPSCGNHLVFPRADW